MNRDFARIFAVVVGVGLLAVLAPWLVRELRQLPAAGALAARSDQRIVTLEVAGMTCTACEAAVKQGLAGVPGVSTSEVRHQQGRAYVVVDRATPDSALTRAVRTAGAGFTAWVVDK
jgi:copper chaperone CopZ